MGIIIDKAASRQVLSRQLNIGLHAKQKRLAIVIAAALAFFLLAPRIAATEITYTRMPWEAVKVTRLVGNPKPVPLTEAQDAWIDRLQRCESQDDPTQVNPRDLDGTPSYYAFQFKPGTFRSFGVAYGVLPRGLTDKQLMEELKRTDLQRAIVAHMIHDPSVDWHVQFPGCVHKWGVPPEAGV